MEFPRDWEDDNFLKHEGLEVVWVPTDTEINYLGRENDYEFEQEDPLESEELKLLTRSWFHTRPIEVEMCVNRVDT